MYTREMGTSIDIYITLLRRKAPLLNSLRFNSVNYLTGQAGCRLYGKELTPEANLSALCQLMA